MSRTTWGRAWRVLVGIGVLALVVAGVDPALLGARLSTTSVPLVVVAVVGLTAIHVVPAIGWRAILEVTTGVRLSVRATLALAYAAQAIGGVTPANLGGDLHRAAALRRSGHGWGAAVAPLVVQRATSYLALSVLALGGLGILAARSDVAAPIVVGGVAFAAAISGAAWLLLAPPAFLRGAHARLTRLAGGDPAAEGGRVPRLGAAGAIGFVSGLGFHAGATALTWLLVVAVDPSMPAAPVLASLAAARLALAVPFAPSGLGVQEGALAVLFVALGLPPEVALAAMLLARLGLVLTTLVGVALLVAARPSLPVSPLPGLGGRPAPREGKRPAT